MGHLLQRGHFMQDMKITSKKLWRNPSQRMPLFRKVIQEFTSMPAYLFHKKNTSPFDSTFKWFSILNNRKFELYNLSNKFSVPFYLGCGDDKQMHSSSTLFLKNYFCNVEEKSLKSLNTDNYLKNHVGSFVEKLHNCTSVDDIFNLTETAIQTNCLNVESLSELFSALQENVYKTISFSWNLSQPFLKRTQLVWNFLIDRKIEPYTTDPRFQNLISHMENIVNEISYDDCVQILHSLFYLFMDITNSKLACKISDRCIDNLQKLTFHQLATFAWCLSKYPHDDVGSSILRKIVNAAEKLLMASSSHSIDLIDICVLFQNIKACLNAQLIDLGTDVIINKLASDPSVITLDSISNIIWFSRIANHDCDERLINFFLEIPSESFDFNIKKSSLTFDVCCNLRSTHWLCPMFQKLTTHCISELNKTEPRSLHDIFTYSLPLFHLPPAAIIEKNVKSFINLVEESDNYLLCQLMQLHSRIDRSAAFKRKDLFWAYHQRLNKLFISHSPDQLDTLLWQNNGYMARYIFETVKMMKLSRIPINQNLLTAIDNHFTLKSSESEPPVFKIIIAALTALDRLRSNIVMTPADLSTLTKAISHLDFIYLMKCYKECDSLSYSTFLSTNSIQQCLKIRLALWEAFQGKLSSTDTLVSSFTSNKILPIPKKHMSGKLAGIDPFVELLNSLPKFLKDDSSHLRALKILDMSVETIPVYQKEMFERLTSFVTSSPKLLIYSGLQLVKVLAHAGHHPENFEIFNSLSRNLATSVLNHGWLDKSTLVLLMYHLSLLGIFHDEFLLKIFSLDFLMALDQELEVTAIQEPQKVKESLALLNRSVAIECPHLSFPWFCKSLIPTDTRSDSVDKVTESVSRLTGGSDFIVKFTESPYRHNIDVLICFEPSSGKVTARDVAKEPSVLDLERIALLCLLPSHFCYESDIMTGKCQANIRQLQILGYTVVVLTPRELSSMELQKEDSLDLYIQTKINNSMHVPVLGDFKH